MMLQFQSSLFNKHWWTLNIIAHYWHHFNLSLLCPDAVTQTVTEVTLNKNLYLLTLGYWIALYRRTNQKWKVPLSLSCSCCESCHVSERETTEAFVIKLQRLQSGQWGPTRGLALKIMESYLSQPDNWGLVCWANELNEYFKIMWTVQLPVDVLDWVYFEDFNLVVFVAACNIWQSR